MAGFSSQGTSFAFAATVYTITSVTVDYGRERERVSGAHMGLGPNDIEPSYYQHRSADSLPTVQIDFIGASAPTVNHSAVLSVAGKMAFYGVATCVSSQVSASLGELVRGSASFRVQV